MAEIEVTLPVFGDDESGVAVVTELLAAVGDALAVDDDLIEIVTDKAAFAVPCPQVGRVKEFRTQADAKIRVGEVICILAIDD